MDKKIFETVIGTVVLLGAELIVVAVLNITSDELIKSSMADEKSTMILTVIVKLTTFIIFTIIEKLLSNEYETMDLRTFLSYIIVPIASLGIMFSVVFAELILQMEIWQNTR